MSATGLRHQRVTRGVLNRQRFRTVVSAFALGTCIVAPGLLSAREKESPIRIGLPGFPPAASSVPRRLPPTSTPKPSFLPKPANEPEPLLQGNQATPTRSAATAGRSRSPIALRDRNPQPRLLGQQTLPATPFDLSRFDNSVNWSLHSNSWKPVSTARPFRASEADASNGRQSSAKSTLDLSPKKQTATAPLVQRTPPICESIDSLAGKPISTRRTVFKTDVFEQSIESSLAALAELAVPTKSTIPVTPFDQNRFASSITNSLQTVQAAAEPEAFPDTGFDQSRFERSLIQSLRASQRTASNRAASQEATAPPIRHTEFDTERFAASIAASLRSSQQAGTAARPATHFNSSRFDRSIKASLSNARFPAQAETLPAPTPTEPTWVEPLPIEQAPQTRHPQTWHPLDDFSPTPIDASSRKHDGAREAWAYDAKRAVPTQHPWIEWGRIFYGDGITPRGINLFGKKNLVRPKLYLYGDFRTGVIAGRNAAGRTDNWANRLNLDLDFQITDTERFHAFVGPLDEDNQLTRLELVDDEFDFVEEVDFTPVTGYFEGDLGVFMGTAHDRTSPFELPFTIGLVPLLFQNGIWMEDAVTGAAFALPARHSRLLNWSNYDAIFFAVFDQLDSVAFGTDEHAAQAFGTAWFIEAYGGYIESGYAFLNDRNQSRRDYHNITTSFTRRYFDRISNSVRVIVNAGQDLPKRDRTADGVLLLVENSWITAAPLTFVPYANFFVGWDRPQSVARAGVSGGILRNTGINFETDGLNGLATLDPTGHDTAGGSIGVDLIGDDLDRQLLIELSYLTPHGSSNAAVPGDQYAVGSRYQFNLSYRTLLRFDAMYGWRRGLQDVYGTRMEYRWKF